VSALLQEVRREFCYSPPRTNSKSEGESIRVSKVVRRCETELISTVVATTDLLQVVIVDLPQAYDWVKKIDGRAYSRRVAVPLDNDCVALYDGAAVEQ